MNLGPLTGADLRMALTIGRQNGSLNTPAEQDWAARMQPKTDSYLKDYGVQGPYYSEFLARVSEIFVNPCTDVNPCPTGDAAGQDFLTTNSAKFPDPNGPTNFAVKKWHLTANDKIPASWPEVRSDLGV